jgi:hypothetical protein
MKGKRIIGSGTLILMVMMSVFVDCVQFLLDWVPVVGWLLNIILDAVVLGIYWLWFKMKGVNFSQGGAPAVSFVVGALLDLVPFVSAFAWTLDVVMVAMTARNPVEEGNMIQ